MRLVSGDQTGLPRHRGSPRQSTPPPVNWTTFEPPISRKFRL
jgi:hypothetical protein